MEPSHAIATWWKSNPLCRHGNGSIAWVSISHLCGHGTSCLSLDKNWSFVVPSKLLSYSPMELSVSIVRYVCTQNFGLIKAMTLTLLASEIVAASLIYPCNCMRVDHELFLLWCGRASSDFGGFSGFRERVEHVEFCIGFCITILCSHQILRK